MQTRLRKTGLTASIAIITLAVILAIGSTFSLFTSNDGNDITVDSATVKVASAIKNVETFSLGVATNDGKFANLGTALSNSANDAVTITNMTPGDEAKVTIGITNESTVLIAYRLKVTVTYTGTAVDEEPKITDVIKVTAKQGETLVPMNDGYTDWAYTTQYTDGTINNTIDDITVSILLPVEAGNDYQNDSMKVRFAIEAVQANAAQLVKVTTADELYAALETNGEAILLGNITLTDDIIVKGNATIDLNGYALTGNIINNGNLIIKDSMGAVTADASGETTESPSGSFVGSITNNGTLTITGGSFANDADKEEKTAIITNGANASLTIENADFVSEGTVAIDNTNNATVIITSGSFVSTIDDEPVFPIETAEETDAKVTVNGGSFSGEVPEDILDGDVAGAPVTDENGNTIIVISKIIIKDENGKGYSTLQHAVDTANVVILNEKIALTQPVNVLEGKNVTIDLNGKTITAGADGYALCSESGSTVTIKDSANCGAVNGVVYNANGGEMIINGGTYNALDGGQFVILNDGANMTINKAVLNGGSSYPIYSYNDGQNLTINDVTINGTFGALNAYGVGNVVINGGTFNMTGVAGKTSHIAYISTGATAVINGGSFNHVGDLSMSATGGGGVCVAGSANVTINGGDFNGDYADVYTYSEKSVLAIKGGTFKFKPASVAEGYSYVQADGKYVVLQGENFQIVEDGLFVDGNTYYVTNANGLLALSTKSSTYFSGKTIKLAKDIDCTDVAMKKIYIWDPENPTTFDGCGYTIYNLDISTASSSSNQGLIHGTVNVKNLTVDGAWVQGYGYVGVIAATLYGNIENCHVKNAQVFAGYWQAGIIVGQFNGTSIKNCSVVDSEIYAPSAVGAIAGIFTDSNATDIKFENCVVKGCDINQTYSFSADYDVLYGAILGCGNAGGKNYIFNDCVVEDTTIRGVASDTICGEADNIWINGSPLVYSADQLAAVVKAGATNILLADGEYNIYGCGGKTLTISGSKNVIIKIANEGEAGSDYGFDGSTVTFNGVTFDTSANNGSYKGFARMVGIYNDCTFNGSYALNKDSEFTNCTFNVNGDAYNIWTWGAPNATFTGCTFNSDGKAILLYGGVDTNLVLNGCTFNDNGGLTDKKAAVEIGNDYGRSYTLTVNNTVVNGYEINDKGINTGSTLWGNKNSMGTDKLNVVVDGVDVY